MYFLPIRSPLINFVYKINKKNQLLKSNIIIMRKPISFIVLLFLSAFTVTNAINIPIEKNTPSTGSTRQRAPMLIPVIVDLSTTDLYLNFTNLVGIANITVTNSNGIIVHQESIDTNLNNELYIPINELEVGDYTITISYGSITLKGVFTL